MYTLHTHCRACGYAKSGAQGIKASNDERLIEVFDLGVQPLANDFCHSSDERAGCAPLKVLFCPRCSLAQLSVVVRPDILYTKYSYVTSPSQMMHAHFEALLSDIASETDGKAVMEIGSNDGKLLGFLQNNGYSVLGVDPADNLCDVARHMGVPTHTGFFGEVLSRRLPLSDIIIARHVFCHVDDWSDFMRAIEKCSHPDTLICIETPYVGDLLKKCEFDTIYHEHLSYLSLKAVDFLLKDSCLRIHKVIRYPIHGGAIMLMLRRKDSEVTSGKGEMDNFTTEDWADFRMEAEDQIGRLKATVKTLLAQGKRIAGLGASAKSTVWVNACGFTRKEISFIADNTPQKQWTVSPGTDIPISDEGDILRDLPDYVIMWAWNYRDEILEKFSPAREQGVKFIVPVPKIEIV